MAFVADAARAENVPVGICGELAGDPGGAVLLLAMGYDVLSMNATSLPRVKKAIRAISRDDASKLLEQVRGMDDSYSIQAALEQDLSKRGLEQFIHKPVS